MLCVLVSKGVSVFLSVCLQFRVFEDVLCDISLTDLNFCPWVLLSGRVNLLC